MMGIISKGVLATDRLGPASHSVRHRGGNNWKTGRNTRINPAKAKVLPQQARIMYFLAVASRPCDMQEPPEKLSGEPQSNSPQSVHAGASIQHG